jgi:DNA-binding response OmpR family regulator
MSSFQMPRGALDRPSLLITDDDRDFRETLAELLGQRGYRTHLAGDGEQAVRIVESEQIHLVLLDMHMPKWTGLETLRRVRKFRATLPCILISAGLDDQILAQARSARAISVLSKPVSCGTVMRTVNEVLRRTYNWRGIDPRYAKPLEGDQMPPSDVDLSNPGA